MLLNKIECPYFVYPEDEHLRIHQGDIFRDLHIAEVIDYSESGEINVAFKDVTYSIVLSQDCDLEQDHNSKEIQGKGKDDKLIPNILLCPAYIADTFREGDHLAGEKKSMQRIVSKDWSKLKKNQIARYHFLPSHDDFQIPELVIDFKRFMAIPKQLLKNKKTRHSYLGTVEILYRELLSSRFAHYLSRIALPEIENS